VKPPIIHLVRHGEVENPNHVVYASLPGFGLSLRGAAQARAAAGVLSEHPIAAIVSSPLQRAAETADVIAGRLGLAVRTDPGLLEWELGERWAGVRWEALDTLFPGEVDAYLSHPHDLDFTPEPLSSLAERVRLAAETAVSAHAERGEVVIVSHQDPIQAARLLMTGRPLRSLQADKPGHCSVVTLARNQAPARWVEVDYWEPDQGEAFPPVPADQS
jgi:broad specificity phosphatase PhoE